MPSLFMPKNAVMSLALTVSVCVLMYVGMKYTFCALSHYVIMVPFCVTMLTKMLMDRQR